MPMSLATIMNKVMLINLPDINMFIHTYIHTHKTHTHTHTHRYMIKIC